VGTRGALHFFAAFALSSVDFGEGRPDPKRQGAVASLVTAAGSAPVNENLSTPLPLQGRGQRPELRATWPWRLLVARQPMAPTFRARCLS
jgi:hypothetical protein